MAELIPDDLDWSAYVRANEASVKVRKASDFRADLAAKHGYRAKPLNSVMFSTKLRSVIEFRPGETTCWAGYSGHRKSMFAGQVALDLCVRKERTLIASMEMLPEETLDRMVRQMAGARDPSIATRDRFSDWTDGRLWPFDHMGRINPKQMLAVSRYFAEELKGQHTFVDSLMMVCGSEDNLDEQKQFMTDVVRVGQETGMHMHLVAHCRKPAQGSEEKPPTKYDLRGSAAITDQAFNVITVWANKAKKAKLEQNCYDEEALAQPDALVSVEKQRNGAWEGRLKLFWDEASMRFVDDRTSPIEPYAALEGELV